MTMTDVNRLLRDYIERYEAEGAPDPSDLLAQVEGSDRARLIALIEGYLEHAAPTPDWDPEAFEGSLAERATERLVEAWEAESAALPRELVALRKRAELPRPALVEQLAAALGFPKQTERVAVYYNAMEHGNLPPAGVSAKVFDALASILDTSAEALRKAGEAVAPSAGGEPGAAFARETRATEAADQAAPSPGLASRRAEEPGQEPDELDRLFTGGG